MMISGTPLNPRRMDEVPSDHVCDICAGVHAHCAMNGRQMQEFGITEFLDHLNSHFSADLRVVFANHKWELIMVTNGPHSNFLQMIAGDDGPTFEFCAMLRFVQRQPYQSPNPYAN